MDFVVSALNKLWSFAGFQPDKSNRTFISLKDIVNGLYSARRWNIMTSQCETALKNNGLENTWTKGIPFDVDVDNQSP